MEFKAITGKREEVTITSSKIETFESLPVMPVVYKGFPGYMPLKNIYVPSFIASVSRVFKGKSEGTNERIIGINQEIKKVLEEINKQRTDKGLSVIETLKFVIGPKVYDKIAMAVGHKINNNNCVEMTFGESPQRQTIFIGNLLNVKDNLSYFLDYTNSFIWNHHYISNFLYDVNKKYVKSGKLTVPCAQLIKSSGAAREFCEMALFGPSGSFSNLPSMGNCLLFAQGDIKFKIKNINSGIVDIEFSEGMIIKSELHELLMEKHLYLIAEMIQGNQIMIGGKRVLDIKVGIYTEEKLSEFRKYINLEG